jgi:hypothetical protein
MLTATALARVFKIGATVVADPAPSASLPEVQRMLTQRFPMLRHTRIYQNDGVLSDDGKSIVYDFPLVPVKTLG